MTTNKAVEDYVHLFELLMDKNIEHQTFETISSTIQKKFDKNDYLSVGTLLTLLIRHGDLPGIIQKCCTFYTIYDLFRSDGQTESPFIPFLLSLFEQKDNTKLNLIERNFLSLLLTNGTKELAKQTPSNFLKTNVYPIPIDLTFLKNHITEKQKELPVTVKCAVPNVIRASTMSPINENNNIRDLMEELCISSMSPLKNTFGPQFMSVAPPLLPFEDELIWLDPTDRAFHKPVYDSSNDIGLHAKKLIEQAFSQALSHPDQQRLLDELKRDPNLVYQIGLTPNKLPDLVENNPLISIEILLRLMNSMQITEYFNILVNMEITLHSLEVVNRLTTSVDLPKEFVHLYINNCIQTCGTMKEKYMQSRLVRLVCVFLQSLIRNKIINVKDLFLEVEAFCIEFSKIKEAAVLYRLLRQLELGETVVTNTKSKE